MGGTSFLRLLQFIPITFCDNFKVSENSTRDYGLAGILDLMILWWLPKKLEEEKQWMNKTSKQSKSQYYFILCEVQVNKRSVLFNKDSSPDLPGNLLSFNVSELTFP